MLTRRTFSAALAATPFIARAQQSALRARIKIDTERVIGDIDPKIYGNSSSTSAVVFEEKSPLSDFHG